MGSTQKSHVVLVPFPAHGHVAPHIQLARVLQARGVHVTLVHTELHHRRLLRAKGETAVSAAGFRVEVIPDGLSPEDPPRTLEAHHDAMERNCLEPFKALLRELRDRPGVPPVSCVVADTPMPFAAEGARQVGVPDVQFFTASACGLMGYLQYEELMRREVIPLKGNDYKNDGSLDIPLDWLPGMKGMRLRDMPTFCHTTDAEEWLVNFHVHQMRIAASSKAVILNTFYEMEKDVLDALVKLLPPIYTVGPIASIIAALPASGDMLGTSDGASLLQEDTKCMAWLDGKPARSVVYVSFGSHANMGGMTLQEFASGLARCGFPYLWVLRPDMVADVEIGKEGLVVPWCAQEAVLSHPAVGLFVSHCGWNSILESVVAGVPVLGCPVIAEQTTNCRQVTMSWGIGGELPQGSASVEIAALVREMMGGNKGMEARDKASEWKRLAEDATEHGGSSYQNIVQFVDDMLLKGF